MKPKSKLLTIIFLACMTIFAGCNDDETNDSQIIIPPFGNQPPTELMDKEDLPQWLIEEIEKLSDRHIFKEQVYKGVWKGETVYCISNSLSSILIYDCFLSDGTKLEWSENNTYEDFVKTSSNWKCIYIFYI